MSSSIIVGIIMGLSFTSFGTERRIHLINSFRTSHLIFMIFPWVEYHVLKIYEVSIAVDLYRNT